MSGEILSQNEIDALLSAISTGEMDADDLKKVEVEKRVKVYDFKRALRFSKDQIRSLTRIHENFARLLTTYFSAQLRTYVQISVASADQIPYEEFIRSIPKMTILNVFEVPPLDGRIILEVDPNIAYSMMDRVLGGRGISVNKVDSLTEIETKIMSNLFEKAFENLQEAWSTIVEIEPEMTEFEVNPQFLQLVSPNDTVVVISLNTQIGETSGMINICIPHVVLEPIIPKLSAHYWMENSQKEKIPEEIMILEKRIRNADLPIISELGSTDITIQDLLLLDVGDVIDLNKAIDEPLTIKIGGVPKYSGQPGKVGKKHAIQILEILKGETKMVSDEMLSQDEIDALLKGTSDIEGEVNSLSIDDYLSMMELDALGEIGNISFGSSATALSTLLNQKVDITTPTVTLIERGQIAEEFPHPYVAIQVQYTEGFSGINMLVIKQSDAAIIADLMLGGDGENPSDMLGEIQLSAVKEAMNQMMGSAATSMSTIFSKKVDISPPSIDLLNFIKGQGENAIPDEDLFAKISFRLRVGNLIDSSIMQLLPVEFAKGLVSELLKGTSDSEPTDMQTQKALSDPVTNIPSQEPAAVQNSRSTQSANEFYGQGGYQPQPTNQIPNVPQHFGVSSVPTGQPVNVQPASFTSFQPYQLQESESKNLSMLMDIPLQVTVELGRTKRSVKDILELSSGSIIELDKLAGEPVDILVNSRLIAKGEVVVIDENFGVRVTDIMSQSERLNKIR